MRINFSGARAMNPLMASWQFWAVLSAGFAALTATYRF
jgi:hypothetical protein